MRRGRATPSPDAAIIDISMREVGTLHNKRFTNRRAASQDLVLRLDVHKKLERHSGPVNTVSFSQDGDLLLSGSDDQMVIIWDWQSGGVKLPFHSGHDDDIYRAKFMFYTDDRTIVTCAANGEIRRAQILDCGQVETKLLGRHRPGVCKLAIEPGSPHNFYTCARDGLVQHFDLRTSMGTPLFTCQSLSGRGPATLRLNTIAIDPRSPNIFAVGGSDVYALLFDIRKYRSNGSTQVGVPVDFFSPKHLIGGEIVPITGLAFSDQSELLVSYSDQDIYLFTKNMGIGSDLAKVTEPQEMHADHEEEPEAYEGHLNSDTVKDVNFFGPNCEYIMSGSDCGRIFIWNKKGGQLIRVMEADRYTVNCVASHPHTTALASCGIEDDIKIWTPKACEKATLPIL